MQYHIITTYSSWLYIYIYPIMGNTIGVIVGDLMQSCDLLSGHTCWLCRILLVNNWLADLM